MDIIHACGACDAGSIPAREAKNNKIKIVFYIENT